MNKRFGLTALIAAALLTFGSFGMISSASAAGINVTVHTQATDIGQLALAGAEAPVIASATASNVAGLSALTGNWTNNVNMTANVEDVIQLGAAGADAWASNGTATATVANVAGLVSADVNHVDNYAVINASATADDVLQGDLAIALAGYSATASAANLAGVATVKVNVSP